MTKSLNKKTICTTVMLAAMLFSVFAVVPGAHFLNTNSNSIFNTQELGSSDHNPYDPVGVYDWSLFTSFTYRIPLEINSSFVNRTYYSVKVAVNFTKALDDAGYIGEEFDEDSVRVVEYEGTDPYSPKLYNATEPIEMDRYVLPSLFIPLDKHNDNYNAVTNALGYLWFEMPGTSTVNDNRTFMIYFDTIENTGGLLTVPESLIWKKDYNSQTDVIGDHKYHLAYGSYQEVAGLNRGELTIWNDDLSATLFKGRPHSNIQRYLNPVPGDFNGDDEVELLVSDRDNEFWLMDYREDVQLFSPLQTVNGDPMNFDTVARDWILAEIGEIPYRWSTSHRNILAADMDHDGYDEIVATTYDRGYNYIFVYNITQDESLNHVLNVQEVINTTDVDIQAMALADFNHDGYLDIIGGDDNAGSLDIHGYTLYFWMNNGTGVYDYFNVSQPLHTGHGDTLPQEVRAISCGDIDNDGNIEVVTTDHDNHDYLYIWQWDMTNTSNDYSPHEGEMEYEGTYDVPTNPNFYEPVVGAMYDWDYDGYTEIIIGNSDAGGNSSLAVIEIKGDEASYSGNNRIVQESEWGQWGNSSIQYHNLYFPRFGDVDNDGDTEFAVGSYRKWDEVNIQEPSVLVFNSSNTSPEWLSPPAYNSVGGGGSATQAMMNIFGAWDNYEVRQEPVSYVHTAKAKNPDLTINVLDMDYGPVQNAKVTITRTGFSETDITDESGKVNFALLNDATYDVEINYSTPYHPEQTVFSDQVIIDSASELYAESTFVTTLQKVYFNVTDSSGADFIAGDLVIWDDNIGGTIVGSKSMDTTYEHYTWLTEPSINTSIQYTNPYYNMVSDYVVNTTVTPDGSSVDSGTFDNTGMVDLGGNDYQFVFDFDQQDSLLNWIDLDIDISGASHYIDSVEVQLVYTVGQDTVFYEDIDGTSTDTWSDSVSLWADSDGDLRIDSLRSNHVRVIVNAHNTSANTGSIDVDLYYQALEDISVPFRAVQLEFIDTDDEVAEGFLIEVYETDLDRSLNATLVNLTTNEFGEAFDLDGNPFYYFDESASAQVNYSIQAKFYKLYFDFAPNNDDHANFTNDGTVSYQFQIDIEVETISYETNITVINTLSTIIDYDQDWDALVYVTATSTGAPFAINAYPTLYVYSVKSNTLAYQADLVTNGTLGYYEVTYNPDENGTVLGGDDYNYYLVIDTLTPGYGSGPESVVAPLVINPINTSVFAEELEIWTWTDTAEFNITYLDRDSNPISSATVTYDAPWLFDSVIVSESGTPGVYTVSIDTTEPGNVGDYILKFSAYKDNYLQQNFDVRLSIRPLATTLNDNDPNDFLFSYITPDVNLTQEYMIYFDYSVSGGAGIEGATATCTVAYTLVDSTTGFESVVIDEVGSGVYVLDYDTETLAEGKYDFDIKFEKLNHDAKVASVTLNMVKKQFGYTVTEGNVENNLLQFTVENGEDQVITIDLKEQLDGSAALNATVQFNGVDFTHDGNGVYTYTVKSGEVNTFISRGLVEGVVTIQQEYFEEITFTVQVTVKMHALIPGVPTFYLAIGLSLVLVAVGAIVLTKVVQNARIPEFVKKCDEVAKEISKKKSIDTRVNVAKTKTEKLAEIFSKEWESLGLDFRVSLGIAIEDKGKKLGEYTYSEPEPEPEPEPYTEPEPESEPKEYWEPKSEEKTENDTKPNEEDEY